LIRVETIGDATLYLGDCLSVLPQLPAVDGVLTDPPYSSGGLFRGDRTSRTTIKYQGHESRHLYPEFSGDNRDQRGYAYWSAIWTGLAREIARPGAILGAFTDWRQLPTTADAIQAGGWVWRGLAVWDKTEGARPQRGRYRNQAEYLVWGSNGPMADAGTCAPGVFRRAVNSERKHHVAGKPVALLADMLEICGEVIADPFMGSGSTGLAALQTGRKFIGCEVNPEYFEIACNRIAQFYAVKRAANA
jgi:site-specific DNA-methyltransferase (adenine-specific)